MPRPRRVWPDGQWIVNCILRAHEEQARRNRRARFAAVGTVVIPDPLGPMRSSLFQPKLKKKKSLFLPLISFGM